MQKAHKCFVLKSSHHFCIIEQVSVQFGDVLPFLRRDDLGSNATTAKLLHNEGIFCEILNRIMKKMWIIIPSALVMLGTCDIDAVMIPPSDSDSDPCPPDNHILEFSDLPHSSTSVEHSTAELFPDDIGEIFVNAGSPVKCTAVVHSLTAVQKYSLLTQQNATQKSSISYKVHWWLYS